MTDKANGTKEFIFKGLLSIALLLAGAVAALFVQRLTRQETAQDTLVKDTSAVERRVTLGENALRVIDARVTLLEDGKRVQFDIQLDRGLLEQQVKQEVEKQLGDTPPRRKP